MICLLLQQQETEKGCGPTEDANGLCLQRSKRRDHFVDHRGGELMERVQDTRFNPKTQMDLDAGGEFVIYGHLVERSMTVDKPKDRATYRYKFVIDGEVYQGNDRSSGGDR